MRPNPGFYDDLTTPVLSVRLGRRVDKAVSVDYSEAAFDRREPPQKQAQQAQRLESLGQLAGGIAHDFNNLLAVILSYTSFVRDDLTSSDGSDWSEHVESACNDLAQVTLAAERASRLTHQLLAFARQEVIRPRVLDLNQVISGVAKMLRPTIGEHLEVLLALDHDLWPVLADPTQIEQVLVNLAVNARDAMPNGGTLTIGTRNVDADFSTKGNKLGEAPQRNVQLTVSDTGTGMTDEVAEHAFEPFFTTKEDLGTGLGLATVYGIVVEAEGDIQIYSEPGAGTTFTVSLPATARLAFLNDDEQASIERTPDGETVLVVEDELALREVTRRIFVRDGYHVLTAANGLEAIEIAMHYEGEIHLLVTDVVMPRMLGKEVAEKIQTIRPDIEVLFMSGYARPALTSQGRLDPNVALVEKPFSSTELLAMAAQVLDGHFSGFKSSTQNSTQKDGGERHP